MKRSLLIVIAARISLVEEALIKMYMAGMSVRRFKNIIEALLKKVSPYTISELKKKAYVHIENWCNRQLTRSSYAYVYFDRIYLKQNWRGEYENVDILIAIGVINKDGYLEVMGVMKGV